jgi:hypothetical protein
VTIRTAVESDLPVLLEMGARFIQSSRYAEVMAVVPEQQSRLFEALLDQGGCFVLESAGGIVGMLGLLLGPLPLTGEVAAMECMWWVEPGFRHQRAALDLWAFGEDWAASQGAVSIQMLQPSGQEALGVLYRRRGYVPIETMWHKRLGEAHT